MIRTRRAALQKEVSGRPLVNRLRACEHLHCTAGSSRSFTAIRKDAGLHCGSRLRKGEVFAYIGLPHNLKDLKSTGFGLGRTLRTWGEQQVMSPSML